MRLLLINPDYMKLGSPPLGFISLAAYVRRECSFLNLKFLDQVTEEKSFNQVKIFAPKVIGFTAVSENYYFVKQLAKKIKSSFPGIILVIGGVHISTSPESFKDSPFDVAVRGEGELAFTKLLKHINKNNGLNKEKLRKIKGLMFREDGEVIDQGKAEFIENLDDLPLPARDLLHKDYYRLPTISGEGDFDPWGLIISSRGCPHNCRFCSSYKMWQQKIRFFSAERVVKEIEILYKTYGYRRILFADDVFTINKPRLRKIISLLKEKDFFGKIQFLVFGRADFFDEETARLLKKLNVVSVTFGIETGSQKVLTYLKRGRIKVEDGANAIKLAKKHGIMGGGFFMLGSPGETIEDMKKTYEFIKDYSRDNFTIHQLSPLPGTEIWEYALNNGFLKKDFYEFPQKEFVDIDLGMVLSKEVSKEEFKEIFQKIKELHINKSRKAFFRKLKTIKLRNLILLFSPIFLRKALSLRKRFVKKYFK